MAPVFLNIIRRARYPRLTTLVLVLITGVPLPLVAHMDQALIAIMRIPALVVGLAIGQAALDEKGEGRPREWIVGLLCLAGLPVLGRMVAPALRGLEATAITDEGYIRIIRCLEAPLLAVLAAYVMEALDRLKLRPVSAALNHISRYSLELFLAHVLIRDILMKYTRLANLPFTAILLAGGCVLAPCVHWAAARLLALWDRLSAALGKPAVP